MTKRPSRQAVPVSDLATQILDPVLRKRAGMSIGLVQSWDAIVGERLAAITRPEKIVWPRRQEDEAFETATLVVACSGPAALRVQHETGEIIGRLNAFFGYAAIGRVRIVQKSLSAPPPKARELRPLSAAEEHGLARTTGAIEDEALRESLKKLGASVLRARDRR